MKGFFNFHHEKIMKTRLSLFLTSLKRKGLTVHPGSSLKQAFRRTSLMRNHSRNAVTTGLEKSLYSFPIPQKKSHLTHALTQSL